MEMRKRETAGRRKEEVKGREKEEIGSVKGDCIDWTGGREEGNSITFTTSVGFRC